MTKGIIFYHNHDITDQLSVAIYSLRKHYNGLIHVTLGPNIPEPLVTLFENQNDISFNKIDKYYFTSWPRRGFNTRRKEWCQKPYVIRDSPFDLTVYYDCDHVFYKEFDFSIFDAIDEHELISSVPRKQPRRTRNILSEFAHIGIPLEKLQSFSGGCIGLKKGSTYIDTVIERLPILANKGPRILRRNPEEFSFSSVLNSGHGSIVDPKWSSNYGSPYATEDNNIAIHYARGRFTREPRWAALLEQVKKENYLGFSDYWKTPGITSR